MSAVVLPSQEVARLNALYRYRILDTPPEPTFNDLIQLAAHLCQTPIALISLVDAHRQWFKAKVGLGVNQTVRNWAFCAHTILGQDALIVEDACTDPRFAHNPLVISPEFNVRFYAGVPLLAPDGLAIGTLCVMDHVARSLNFEQQDFLQLLSRQVMSQLELRRQVVTLSQSLTEYRTLPELEQDSPLLLTSFFETLEQQERITQSPSVSYAGPTSEPQAQTSLTQTSLEDVIRCRAQVLDALQQAVIATDLVGKILYWNPIAETLYGYSETEAIGQNILEVTPTQQSKEQATELMSCLQQGQSWSGEFWVQHRDGTAFPVFVIDSPIYDDTGTLIGIVGISINMREQDQGLQEESEKSIDAHLPGEPSHSGGVESPVSFLGFSDRSTKILESISDAFFALDQDWCFVYLNERAEQVLARSRSDVLGRSLWETFPETVGSIFEQEYRRSVAQQVTVHFEENSTSLGLWFEVHAYPYQDGLAVYFRDVSDRKRIEAELLENSRLASLSTEVSLNLAKGSYLADTLSACTEAMVTHLDVAFARIWTLELENNLLELQAVAGQHSHTEDFPARIPVGISIIGFIAQTQKPYLSNDVLHDVCIGATAWLEREGIVGFTGYPLIVEDRLVGVMALFSRQTFSSKVNDVLGGLANCIAVTVDRAWVREELLSRRESLLFRLASQIRNSLDLDTILATAVTEIRTLLKIDRCHFIWCWPQPEQVSLAITHEACEVGLPSLLGDLPSPTFSPLVKTILNQEIIRIDDAVNEFVIDSERHAYLTSPDMTSQLLLPLETRSGQLGAIVCSHCNGPRMWSDSEVELLRAVTDQLAIAMDQAELYAQTRATAFAAQNQAQQLSGALQKLQQTQAQLVQTEKMSSLGQMVAGVAHEINNPVNFITGNLVYAGNYIQDLLRLVTLYHQHYPEPVPEIQQVADEIDLEFLADDLLKLLSSMKMGAERIRQIVLSLRNFSRLDEAEMKPVDIHEGLDSTLLILQNRLKGGDGRSAVQVVKDYAALPQVECYAGQLNQVFMNILSNALDAMESQPDPRIITIHTAIAPDDPEAVLVRIGDNGQGIPESVQKRLFDPFFTTKPVGKGTGLGLSISYQIVVEKHGGTLKCHSEPGQGTEFWIQIPLTR